MDTWVFPCWMICISIFSAFEEPPYYFPELLYHKDYMFPFFYILSTSTLVILTVNFMKGWGDISLWFWFASPWLLKMLNTFLYTCLLICISSLEKKMSIQILCPFLIRWLWWWWWYDYFGYWVVWISCLLWILIPYQIHSLQIFLPSLGCLPVDFI